MNDGIEYPAIYFYVAENIERASKITSVYSTWKVCDGITHCKLAN